MRSLPFAVFLLACAVLLVPGTVHAQFRGRPLVQMPPARPATPQAQPQPQTEAPQSRSVVEVKDGKLSVDLVDAALGNVMNDIATKLQIGMTITGSVYGKKVSTRFSGLEAGRAIQRLLSLASETNYTFYYNEDGKLNRVVLYRETPASALNQEGPVQPRRVNRPRWRNRFSRPRE